MHEIKSSFKSEILFCLPQLLMFCNQKPNSAYFDHNNPLSMNCSQLTSAVLAPSWRILDKLVGFCSYLRPGYGWGFVWGLLPGGSQGWTDGVLLYNGVFHYDANKLHTISTDNFSNHGVLPMEFWWAKRNFIWKRTKNENCTQFLKTISMYLSQNSKFK